MDDGLHTVQHLLRNLNDFSRLRKNAWVESLRLRCNVNGHVLQARVRAAVVRSLETIVRQHSAEFDGERAKRWRAIIERCDLSGEAYATVAADLGLSRSRFYFERKAAQESLAATLIQELDTMANVTLAIPSAAEMRIEFAVTERARGHVERAARILEEVVASEPDRAQQLAAITELLETYRLLGTTDLFPSFVAKARALCYDAISPDPAFETEMQIIEAIGVLVNGSVQSGIEVLERALDRLMRTGSSLNRRHSSIALRLTLWLFELYYACGNAIGMDAYLAHAETMLEQSSSTLSELRSWYFCMRAEFALFRGDLRRAVEMASEGLPIARDNGLIAGMVESSRILGRIYFEGRQLEPARKHAQNAFMLSELLDAPDRIKTSLLLANIERLSGHAEHALALATATRDQFSDPDFRNWSSCLNLALTLNCVGRSDEALQILDATSAFFLAPGMQRYLGVCERIRAELYSNLDRDKEARAAVDNALHILERHGSLWDLGTVYELSARLGRNRLHKQRSREIRAQLTLPEIQMRG